MFCLLSAAMLHAQNLPLWTQTINSQPDSAYLFPEKVVTDHNGNVVALSTYSKTIASVTEFRIVVNKYNMNGNHLWNFEFTNGGTGSPRGFALAIDTSDNIYVAGGLMTSPNSVPLLIRISPSGFSTWQRTGTVAFANGSYSKMIIRGSNIYLSADLGVAMFLLSGTELWSHSMLPTEITVDHNGEMLVSSNDVSARLQRFDQTGNVDLTDTTITADRIAGDSQGSIYLLTQYPGYRLVKLDSTGTLQWDEQNFPTPPPFGDISFDVLVDFNADVIVTGLSDTMFKFTPAGTLIWKKSMGGMDQYINVPKITYNNLLVIGATKQGSGGYDIDVRAFNLMGNANWYGTYSSNSTQEFTVDMCIDPDRLYILEDSISSSNLLAFDSPFYVNNFDFSELCVDSVWYEPGNPSLINISVFNGSAGQLNYPSIQMISSTGDTVSNIHNVVNFFAQIPNTHQVYQDTITDPNITDFSEYTFVMYDGFGTTSGQIEWCTSLGIDDVDLTGIYLYPNPATSEINIAGLNSDKIKSLQILDITGRTIRQISHPDAHIYIGDLAGGVYYLRLFTGSRNCTVKLLKTE